MAEVLGPICSEPRVIYCTGEQEVPEGPGGGQQVYTNLEKVAQKLFI